MALYECGGYFLYRWYFEEGEGQQRFRMGMLPGGKLFWKSRL